MPVQDTSRAAFALITPTLGDRQQVVLQALLDFHRNCRSWPTAYELFAWMRQRHLAKDINDVRPRLTELRDERHAVATEQKKRRCGVTGRSAFTWQVVTTPSLF
jgi:hypothetical protein